VGFQVDPSEFPHSIEINGRATYPTRRGSTTDYLSGFEIGEWIGLDNRKPEDSINNRAEAESQIDHTIKEDWIRGVRRSGNLGDMPLTSAPQYSGPSNRVVTSTNDLTVVLPRNIGFDPLDLDTLIYTCREYIQLETQEDLTEFFHSVEELLGCDPERDLHYSIIYGNRQLVGRHASNLLSDSARINDIVEIIHPGSGSPDDPRPIAFAAIRTKYGLLWLQFQWIDGGIRRSHSQCGLVIPSIPIDAKPIEKLFNEFDAGLTAFTQNSRLQYLHVLGNGELQNPHPVHLKTELPDAYREIIADNPFYENEGLFSACFDEKIPDHFVNGISAVNRLPYDVSGGWGPDEEKFDFYFLEVLSIWTTIEVFVVNPYCNPDYQA
jgi:hypothetical protein